MKNAFTLIELLVVISIITVLAAIGLTVGTGLVRSNEIRRTKAILANCEQVRAEYEVTTQQVINHWGKAAFDWSDPLAMKEKNATYGVGAGAGGVTVSTNTSAALQRDSQVDTTADRQADFQRKAGSRFVYATMRLSALRKLYATFTPQTLVDKDGDGFVDLLDVWGNKIVYVAFVRDDKPVSQAQPLPPLPFQIGNLIVAPDEHDSDDFMPKSTAPYFASAGPDGKWGNGLGDTQQIEDASDNIYSTEVLQQ